MAKRQSLMQTTNSKTIRGIQVEELLLDGKRFWRIGIQKAFQKNGDWWFGLNDRLLKEARENKIEKLIVEVGRQTMYLRPLTEKELKEKEAKGEFERRKSKFAGYPDWKIYHFKVEK